MSQPPDRQPNKWQFSISRLFVMLTVASVCAAVLSRNVWLVLTAALAFGAFWAVFGIPIIAVAFLVSLLVERLQQRN